MFDMQEVPFDGMIHHVFMVWYEDTNYIIDLTNSYITVVKDENNFHNRYFLTILDENIQDVLENYNILYVDKNITIINIKVKVEVVYENIITIQVVKVVLVSIV